MPAGLNVLLPQLFFPLPSYSFCLQVQIKGWGGGELGVGWGKEEGGKREEMC